MTQSDKKEPEQSRWRKVSGYSLVNDVPQGDWRMKYLTYNFWSQPYDSHKHPPSPDSSKAKPEEEPSSLSGFQREIEFMIRPLKRWCVPKKVDACLKLESILPNAPLSHTWVLARQRNGSCILACLDTYAHGPFHYLDASRPKRWLYMYSDAILHLIQDAVPGRRPVGLLINNHTTAISFLKYHCIRSYVFLFMYC